MNREEPPPAEIICDLNLIEFGTRGFGIYVPMSEKKQAKARARLAQEMLGRNEPFILDGVRYGPEK